MCSLRSQAKAVVPLQAVNHTHMESFVECSLCILCVHDGIFVPSVAVLLYAKLVTMCKGYRAFVSNQAQA